MKILFVCTGNTCRSPMAEAMATQMFLETGKALTVASAGLAALPGASASAHATTVMSEQGLDLTRHKAQICTAAMMQDMDLVLAMSQGHKRRLSQEYPLYASKVHTLGEYAGYDRDIEDPFGMDCAAYRSCAHTIKGLLAKIMEKLMREDMMGSLHVTTHPLVQSKITMLRNVRTGDKEFRELVEEIATLICYEATRDIPLADIEVETPICVTQGKICDRKFGIVPILRAGLGMVEGISNLLPTAKIGHIGMYRDPESLQPVEYYCKLPSDCAEREIFLLDPMLATGGTASAAIGYLKERGVHMIKLVCLIAAPEGVARIQANHPEVSIYTAAYDERLNSHGYIVPGLGDAGDRLFGTK